MRKAHAVHAGKAAERVDDGVNGGALARLVQFLTGAVKAGGEIDRGDAVTHAHAEYIRLVQRLRNGADTAEKGGHLLGKQRREQRAGRPGRALRERGLAQDQFPGLVGKIQAGGAADMAADVAAAQVAVVQGQRPGAGDGFAIDAEAHGVQFREEGTQRQRQRAADLPGLQAGSLRRRERLAAQIEMQYALARVGDGERRFSGQQRARGRNGARAGERRRAGAKLIDEGNDEVPAREGDLPRLGEQPLAIGGGEIQRRRARGRAPRVALIAIGLGLHLRPDGSDVCLHLGEHAAGQAQKPFLAAADEHVHTLDTLQFQQRAGDGQVHAQKFLFALHIAGVDGKIHRHQTARDFAGDHPRIARGHVGLRHAGGGIEQGVEHHVDQRLAALHQQRARGLRKGNAVAGGIVERGLVKVFRRRLAQQHLRRLDLRLGQRRFREPRRMARRRTSKGAQARASKRFTRFQGRRDAAVIS